MIMTRLFGTATVLAMTTAFALQAGPIRISTIDVQTDLAALEYNALDYWPEIEIDLRNAIAAKTADLQGDVAYDVNVRIDAISLNGSGLLTGDGEFNHLRGELRAYPEGNPVQQYSYPIEMAATTDDAGFIAPDAIVLPPLEGEFYAALVDAFAAQAATYLAAIDSDGPIPATPAATSDGDSGSDTAAPEAAPDDSDPGVEDTDAETDAGTDADADSDASEPTTAD